MIIVSCVVAVAQTLTTTDNEENLNCTLKVLVWYIFSLIYFLLLLAYHLDNALLYQLFQRTSYTCRILGQVTYITFLLVKMFNSRKEVSCEKWMHGLWLHD